MKSNTILTTLLGAAAMILGANHSAEASSTCGSHGPSHGGHGSHHGSQNNSGGHGSPHGGSYGSSHHGRSYGNSRYAPVRLLYTREIGRRHEFRTGYSRCGRPYTYRVTVITYRETYSTGKTRIYSKTLA